MTEIKTAIIVVLSTLFLFVVIEGLGSTAVSLSQVLRAPSSPTISHYDELLGWVSIPGNYVPDMYGPGKYARTNAQGFRNNQEIDLATQDSGLRIICSGNSFAFGEGVANEHAWCNQLSVLDGRFETVNMGQPGFGVDQMFLRYRRDGLPIDHSIHIFAFIGGDLNRMAYSNMHRHGKPVMTVSNGELVVENVPVPRLRWSVSRVLDKADFRSVDFARRLLARLSPSSETDADIIGRVGPVATKIFQTLEQMSDEKKVVPVFVFLPAQRDIGKDQPWYLWAKATMQQLALPFIDLTPALRAVPAGQAATFFIPDGQPAAGHYTEAGNAWVAEQIYRQMVDFPAVNALLAER